jgi:hypothetical protein
MNIFSNLQVYAGKWAEKSRRNFSQEEINAVDNTVVVSSNYGLSVCFFMKSGGQTFIPLSNDATVGLGESVDLQKASLITLSKQGESDIIRVSI